LAVAATATVADEVAMEVAMEHQQIGQPTMSHLQAGSGEVMEPSHLDRF